MTSVVIGHVIGTVTLLMVFFALSGYYENYIAMLNQQSYNEQLNQVSSYLASNMVDLVTLAQITPGDQFLVKQVTVPYSIDENLYNITLVLMPSSKGDVEVAQIVTSIDQLNQYASVELPWSTQSNVSIYTNQVVPSGYLLLANHVQSDCSSSQSAKIKKPASMMMWCMKKGSTFVIGFGVTRLS